MAGAYPRQRLSARVCERGVSVAAAELHFRAALLRLSLAAYAWPRVIRLGCLVAPRIWPRRGMVAGAH